MKSESERKSKQMSNNATDERKQISIKVNVEQNKCQKQRSGKANVKKQRSSKTNVKLSKRQTKQRRKNIKLTKFQSKSRSFNTNCKSS